MNGRVLKNKTIHGNTIGFTPSFTSFVYSEIKITDTHNITYSFYLRKSFISNFITCYGVITTTLIFGDEKVHYPSMFVASPIGPYKSYFKEGWRLLTQAYPESVYLPFCYLTERIDNFTLLGEKENNVYDLIFGRQTGRILMISGDKFYNPSLPPDHTQKFWAIN